MSLRRLRAVARKEFLQVFRDPRSLLTGIAIPMLLLVLFGYALSLDVDNVPLVLYDQSLSPRSRDLASRFAGSRYFSLVGVVRSYPDLERAIDSRRALAALVVPPDFQSRVDSGRPAAVQLIVDGSDSNTATIAIGYADAIASAYSEEIARTAGAPSGRPPLIVPLDFRPRVFFNPELKSRNFVTPGLIAVIMMIVASLLTSLTVAREWELGTMEQLLSTPVKGPELILGKLIPYFAIGFFDVLLAVLTARYLFHVPMRGSVFFLLSMSAVFLAGALALGMIVSVSIRNQLLASQIAIIVTFLPAFLLSGFVFSIANMPFLLRLTTYLVPARYFVALLKGIYLKGIGPAHLLPEVALLVVFAGVALLLAVLRFRKSLE
ncbi:MAG: ABC transporter permease [Planctomycetota bacterium]